MPETPVQSLGREDPLEKETATLSSILAWEILWTEEPVRLQSMGSPESDTTEWINDINPHSLTHSQIFFIPKNSRALLQPYFVWGLLRAAPLSGWHCCPGITHSRVTNSLRSQIQRLLISYPTHVTWRQLVMFFSHAFSLCPCLHFFFSEDFVNVDHFKSLHWVCHNIISALFCKMAVLGLRGWAGFSPDAVHALLGAAASLVADHGLWSMRTQ